MAFTRTAFKYLKRLCYARRRGPVVADALRGLGLIYEIQEAPGCRNIIVHFGNPWVRVIGAHYDKVRTGQGANDNGAAVAQLLALAARLKREGYQRDLTIVFFDQEELLGYGRATEMGSALLASWLDEEGIRPEIFLVLDVTGRGDSLIISDSYDLEDPDLERMEYEVSKTCTENGLPMAFHMTPPSDDAGLEMYDIPALLVCVLPDKELSGACWTWDILHTRQDTIRTIQRKAMKLMDKFLYALVQRPVQARAKSLVRSGA